MSKTIALYGGGFKPPTGGHSQVVEEFLNQNSDVEGLIIFVGKKGRDGVTQDQSLKVWEIYLKHLPKIIQLHPCKAPIGDIIRFLKTHHEDKLTWVLGAREGRDDDLTDIDNRTSRFKDKYPNLTIKVITTKNSNMSGTNARKSLKQSKEELVPYLPKYLSKEEEEEIWGLLSQSEEPIEEDITKSELDKVENFADKLFAKLGIDIEFTKHFLDRVNDRRNGKPISTAELIGIFKKLYRNHGKPLSQLDDDLEAVVRDFNNNINVPFIIKVKEDDIEMVAKTIMRKKDFKTSSTVLHLNENATYSENIDYKQNIKEITRVILTKYPNINQVPKLILKHEDITNAQNFLGKTAYYDPNIKTIVLYTEGRHPKDIMKSYTHELQHFIQDMEGRLGNVQTTNTNEDEHLLSLEKEAYLEGNINFRNWTDSLQEIQEPSLERDVNPKELEREYTDDVEENRKDIFGLTQFIKETFK